MSAQSNNTFRNCTCVVSSYGTHRFSPSWYWNCGNSLRFTMPNFVSISCFHLDFLHALAYCCIASLQPRLYPRAKPSGSSAAGMSTPAPQSALSPGQSTWTKSSPLVIASAASFLSLSARTSCTPSSTTAMAWALACPLTCLVFGAMCKGRTGSKHCSTYAQTPHVSDVRFN